MIERAKTRATTENLSFSAVSSPVIPLPDQSIDLVISLLSFRYLDWDPIMNEIRRVLAPGGRLLVVDMVTVPVGLRDLPQFFRSVVSAMMGRWANRRYRRALRALVEDDRWQTMLRYNPIRAQHELVWYLESRFPGRRVETINVGRHARILAFDSGPLEPGVVPPQSYP
jgi:SAM-dependent methyltransferase